MSEGETLQLPVIGILGIETSEMIDQQLAEMSIFDLNTISDLGLQLSPADLPAATTTQVEVTLEKEQTHGQAILTSKRQKIHKKKHQRKQYVTVHFATIKSQKMASTLASAQKPSSRAPKVPDVILFH